jgi:ribosomal protein S18 acetylase RimI-like enzyme
MDEIITRTIHPDIRTLLSFATSDAKVEEEYASYIHSTRRKLFGLNMGNALLGCIGVEFLDTDRCEIRHIAVMPMHRGESIGHKMIEFIINHYSVSCISAETDRDAVLFYKKIGFEITSLGEKYPGVERFGCVMETN